MYFSSRNDSDSKVLSLKFWVAKRHNRPWGKGGFGTLTAFFLPVAVCSSASRAAAVNGCSPLDGSGPRSLFQQSCKNEWRYLLHAYRWPHPSKSHLCLLVNQLVCCFSWTCIFWSHITSHAFHNLSSYFMLLFTCTGKFLAIIIYMNSYRYFFQMWKEQNGWIRLVVFLISL